MFRWQLKYTYLVAGLFFAMIFILYFLFGSVVFGFENDKAIIYRLGGITIDKIERYIGKVKINIKEFVKQINAHFFSLNNIF